ncbi:MAG: hypothetical protein IJ086_00585 [Clostridium sp.]|nr:hypothetical protein [Clostridium sp.]
MNKIYEIEREGQIDFFKNFRIDYENEDVLINNTDGVIKGNILEFKLKIDNLNKTLFQTIKYLSKMRIKGESVPANILLISLNDTTIYRYESKDYFDEIHKVYVGASSKNNESFIAKDFIKKYNYSNSKDTIEIMKLLNTNDYMPIDMDENCIVGWAERYYRELPTAKKGDFLGDEEGQIKIIGEIREPKHFKGLINPYNKKTNEKFKYLMDKLNDNLSKKDLGAFYTPEPYCIKTAELVRKAIANVPEGNDYVIIDRCAGTGNLESVLTDDELEHCILSTYEYYEYKVLMERLGGKVKFIVPPREDLVEYSNGYISNANALSKAFVEEPSIKEIIDDPKMTIILLENPPYQDSSAITFVEDGDLSKRAKTNRSEAYVLEEFKKEISKLNEQRGSSREISNLFIWSGFKYYLRQPTDSYILISPVKYFKSIGLVKKEFGGGFAFNRKYFHATPSVISCIWWKNIDDFDTDEWKLEAFDIEENSKVENMSYKLVNIGEPIKIKRCFKNISEYNDRRVFEDDIETTVVCQTNGYEEIGWVYKKGRKPIYNKNIIGYLTVINYAIDAKNYNLVRCNLKKGLEQSFGFHLRSDNFMEKLPIFCAKNYPQSKWYEKDVYFTPSDNGTLYTKDTELIKSCLIYTCLSRTNRCMSFVSQNGVKYDNELCFDVDTLASKNLKDFTLNDNEKELIEIWNRILEESKNTKNYDKSKKYGIYQISKELNTSYKDEKNKTHYDYPILNGDLESLKSKLKLYYDEFVLPKLFEYELIK